MIESWKPNLFIPGFAKSGTTELCSYLSQHPDFFVPWEKEPNTFYDLEKYPAYFSGDPTGLEKHNMLNLSDYTELFSGSERYRYRVDGTVSYTFDAKFASILKRFSESAKVLILIRDQKQRLASMYYFSISRHRQKDFQHWIGDFFLPYMNTYMYYDKVLSYYNAFGEQLRLVETSNLGSPKLHKRLFEFLDVEPVRLQISNKNRSLLGPDDSRLHRNLVMGLISLKVKASKISKSLGLENEYYRAALRVGDHIRDIVPAGTNEYSEIISRIPSKIASALDHDLASTVDLVIQKGILIRS